MSLQPKKLHITSEILRALNKLLGSSCFGKTEDSMMLASINLAFFAFFMLWGIHHTNSATCSSFDVTRHLSVGDAFFLSQSYPSYFYDGQV